jgi:hypothetical protein
VIPAKAGIHPESEWIPAFAGMTNEQRLKSSSDSTRAALATAAALHARHRAILSAQAAATPLAATQDIDIC